MFKLQANLVDDAMLGNSRLYVAGVSVGHAMFQQETNNSAHSRLNMPMFPRVALEAPGHLRVCAPHARLGFLSLCVLRRCGQSNCYACMRPHGCSWIMALNTSSGDVVYARKLTDCAKAKVLKLCPAASW